MANSSVYLRSLMEDTEGIKQLNKALASYPLYTPKKSYDLIPTREELNKKLLNRHKYKEIGFDTIGRFLDELEITMCEIMPHYNELFKTVEIMAELPNPFDNVDVVEEYSEQRTHHASNQGTATGTTESSSSSNVTSTGSQTATSEGEQNNEELKTSKRSDTPQGSIENINRYLTEYEENEGTGQTTSKDTSSSSNESSTTGTDSNTSNNTASSTGSTEGEETTHHTYTKKGNQGVNTYAHDMNEFRTSIIDVVEQIINDERINNLFMLVW